MYQLAGLKFQNPVIGFVPNIELWICRSIWQVLGFVNVCHIYSNSSLSHSKPHSAVVLILIIQAYNREKCEHFLSLLPWLFVIHPGRSDFSDRVKLWSEWSVVLPPPIFFKCDYRYIHSHSQVSQRDYLLDRKMQMRYLFFPFFPLNAATQSETLMACDLL